MIALKGNLPYFTFYFIALGIGIYLVSLGAREETFLALNTYHTPFLDRAMSWYTYLGTPIFSVFLLGFCNKHKFLPSQYVAAYYLFGGLVLLMVIFLLKNYFHMPRPLAYPEIKELYKPIADAPRLYTNSYPSGHTATIFYTITSYLLINKYNRLIQFSFLLIGVSVAYSRIYVWAHFLEDVITGSYIGMMIPVILYCFFYKKLDEYYY